MMLVVRRESEYWVPAAGEFKLQVDPVHTSEKNDAV